jgi:proteasome lid subunit RPN8/RPN11
MENDDQHQNKESLKNAIKKKIKDKLKQELLDEIYQELKLEEEDISEEIAANLTKKHQAKPKQTKANQKSVVLPESEKIEEGIRISVNTILKIASHALKYANEKIPRDNWVEVIGLLAGKLEKDDISLSIEDAYPMGHGSAINAEIKDYKNYVRAFNDIKNKGLFICGWYHSHPSYGCFMSEEDMDTQARYQKLWDNAVALVIDPYQIDGTSYGFQIFQANLTNNKWFPVQYDIKGILDVKMLPELLKFISPIIDGKAIYLEYDEDK